MYESELEGPNVDFALYGRDIFICQDCFLFMSSFQFGDWTRWSQGLPAVAACFRWNPVEFSKENE